MYKNLVLLAVVVVMLSIESLFVEEEKETNDLVVDINTPVLYKWWILVK